MSKSITGFSKLPKLKKLQWIVENFFKDPEGVMKELKSYWLSDPEKQNLLDQFSENTISNFYLPYGVAPNFIINGTPYCIPMVIEESSVVAAAANAAKYWQSRGGFHAEVISTEKIGQVHFTWPGDIELLRGTFDSLETALRSESKSITQNMKSRGGGVGKIDLVDLTKESDNTYQLRVHFQTVDSMGANFINSVLESFAQTLVDFVGSNPIFHPYHQELDIIMSILSNYTPGCLVKAWVTCPVEELGTFESYGALQLAERFKKAVHIAQIDPYRAVTHNKGIFNGIDSVIIATANDFRAVEANGHAYAARDGQYRGLTDCTIIDGNFKFSIEIPMAVGTIGGLTSLHPMAKHSLELLGYPDAPELMKIITVMGLAQNFAAVRSLVTTGIQKGHMKMHLQNVLASLGATEHEIEGAVLHFSDRVVSYSAVREYLLEHRSTFVKEGS